MKSTHSTVIAAASLVALALTATGPPATAMYAASDGVRTAPAGQSTAQDRDLESLLAARHQQMDAAWRVGPVTVPVTAQVTALRRTGVSWVL